MSFKYISLSELKKDAKWIESGMGGCIWECVKTELEKSRRFGITKSNDQRKDKLYQTEIELLAFIYDPKRFKKKDYMNNYNLALKPEDLVPCNSKIVIVRKPKVILDRLYVTNDKQLITVDKNGFVTRLD